MTPEPNVIDILVDIGPSKNTVEDDLLVSLDAHLTRRCAGVQHTRDEGLGSEPLDRAYTFVFGINQSNFDDANLAGSEVPDHGA